MLGRDSAIKRKKMKFKKLLSIISISFDIKKLKLILNKAQHDYEDTKHVFDKIV